MSISFEIEHSPTPERNILTQNNTKDTINNIETNQKITSYIHKPTEHVDKITPIIQQIAPFHRSKENILQYIYDAFDKIRYANDYKPLRILDGTAGTGSISRMFIPFAKELHVNDNEYYAHILNRTYVDIPDKDMRMITQLHMDNMNYIATHGPFVTDGPIQKKYSPKDTQNIQKGEPCFFTRENAIILDTLKEYVVKNIIVAHMYVYLGAIIRAALKHANIEDGHFQKYRKDKNGCGTFFINDETKRPYKNVMDVIQLEMPEWYDTEVDCKINFYNKNILELIKEFDNNSLDVIFLDPPVNNQVHYRKHYKVLNEIARTRKTMKLKDMPPHSNLLYDRESAIMAFTNFIKIALKKTKYVIISFSPDGIISENDWINIVKETQVCIKMFQIRHKQKNNASTEEYTQPNTTKTNYELLYVLRNF